MMMMKRATESWEGGGLNPSRGVDIWFLCTYATFYRYRSCKRLILHTRNPIKCLKCFHKSTPVYKEPEKGRRKDQGKNSA